MFFIIKRPILEKKSNFSNYFFYFCIIYNGSAMISAGIESRGLSVQHVAEAFCLFLIFYPKTNQNDLADIIKIH